MLAISKQPFSYTHNVINQPPGPTSKNPSAVCDAGIMKKRPNLSRFRPLRHFPPKNHFLKFFIIQISTEMAASPPGGT